MLQEFTLTTECACPGTCKGGGGGGGEPHHHSSSSEIGITGLVILSVYVYSNDY